VADGRHDLLGVEDILDELQRLRFDPPASYGVSPIATASAPFNTDGTKWDGLYVGRRKGADLVYAGKVDHGFDTTSTAELRRRLEPLVRKTQPLRKADRSQGRLGRAEAACRNRVPGEVGRGQGQPPVLQGPS
jgi:hypothetical protein